jgi:hypothetical protein
MSQRVRGNKELSRGDQGLFDKPGHLTTSELIAAIDAEPVGTERYASLAAEAVQRAALKAFPAHRASALAVSSGAKA